MHSPGYRRIVVKVGTNVLTTKDGLLNDAILASLAEQITAVRKNGTEVIFVSSGAMAAGRIVMHNAQRLSLSRASAASRGVALRQVLAAVGQVELMHRYSVLFKKHGGVCAQVLATKEDFRDRQHYLNMRDCFSSLLREKILPIVNENDVVSVSELMFTDNDELAALIASMVNADALLLLTSVDGILAGTETIRTVRSESDWKSHIRADISSFGRGGMQTKCRNAQKLAALGIATHIARGTDKDVVPRLLAGEELGTVFVASKAASSKKRWVAEGAGNEKGTIIVNPCARDILASTEKAASLLPVGIVGIEGEFEKGDLVRIRDEKGKDVGLGIAQYASGPAKSAMGKKGQKALVHYDYLYLFP